VLCLKAVVILDVMKGNVVNICTYYEERETRHKFRGNIPWSYILKIYVTLLCYSCTVTCMVSV